MKVYQGEDLRTSLMNKFDEKEKLDIDWNSVTHYIKDFELKKEGLKKWLNICGNAFVRAWVGKEKIQQFQREKKKVGGKKTESSLDHKGNPSLRKSLT